MTLSRRSFVSSLVASLAAVPLLKGRVKGEGLPSVETKSAPPKKKRTIWIGHSF